MKRLMMIAVAVAVLALGAVAIGGAAAEEDDGLVGSFLARVAEKLGVSEDELTEAVQEAQLEMADEAVAEGRLTEEQAQRLRERVEEGGILFPPRPRHGGAHPGWAPGLVTDAAAQVLDMEKEELIEARQDGTSLAEVAIEVVEPPMSVEDFKAELRDQIRAQLDELVVEGDLTQTQADDIFQRTEDNIDGIVTGEGCGRGFGGMRPGPGGFGGLGFGPFSGGGAESTESSDVTA